MSIYHPANPLRRSSSAAFAERLEHIGDALARRPQLLTVALAITALLTWITFGWTAWVVYDVTERLPGRSELAGIGDMARATTAYDAADRPAFTFHKEQRMEVPLGRVSPHVIRAVVAIEDQRFFQHRGIDLVRVAAAAVANLREGRAAQGGSTITQQLARQSFLTREKTLRRKLKEVVLASRIEQAYTKEQILELYLNKVYFGDGLYGVEAAARGFLGKSAADLNEADAALLAGLIKSPSTYAPTINLERALSRRNVALAAMLDERVIDEATYQTAREQAIDLRSGLKADERFGLYFKEQVRRELVERFGAERVYESGLRVYTTLDAALQKAADELVEEQLARVERLRRYPHRPRAAAESAPASSDQTAEAPEYLQGALVALDPRTGAVRALVGGRNFNDSPFNRAVQARRQAGSAFKPFVYAAALESGFTPATLLDRLDDPVLTPQGEWVPEDEHSEAAQMTMRTALRTSSNRAAVRMLQAVGIGRAVEYARRLNLGTPPSVPSLALGSGTVTLLDMTTAYAAFANGGLVRPPVFIRRVEDAEGTVLYEAPTEPQRALSETTAFLVANMLSDVVNAGTAYRARAEGFTLPAAGKTGTTNEYVDAWFVGFTPQLATGVWMGFDRPKTIMPNGYAGELAVPLWASFMKVATKHDKPVWLTRPRGVISTQICRLSGQLADAGCYGVEVMLENGETQARSMVYTENFVAGTEPITTCPLHGGRSFIDRLADLFRGETPAPPALPAAVPASTPTADSAVAVEAPAPAAEAAPPQPAPQKKRGFWSRIFGRGR